MLFSLILCNDIPHTGYVAAEDSEQIGMNNGRCVRRKRTD